jgi:hypothetical protein
VAKPDLPVEPDPFQPSGRDVAQPGSVPEWGSGGPRFKSGRPDQLLPDQPSVEPVDPAPLADDPWPSAGGELPLASAIDDDPPAGVPSAAWVLVTPLLPWLVALPGGSWLLPLAAPFTIFPAFAQRVRERRYAAAWSLGMLWAALLSLGVIVLTCLRPRLAGAGILHGVAYRDEMFGWIRTGHGKETTPAAFVPEHLFHLALFIVLTLASGGYLGLALGAFLIDFMSYFVASVVRASTHPALASIAAWVPWSVVRVMAFVLIGALLARPLLARQRWGFERKEQRLFALAAAGIVGDLLMKTLLAPGWGLILRRLITP